MTSATLCLFLALTIFVSTTSSENIFYMPTNLQGRPVMLPPQHKLQSLVSQLNNIGHQIPHNEQATQVRKQLFSRKFWRR